MMPLTMRLDDSAILGMPFRLLVGMVSLSIVVPTVLSGWSSVDYIQTERHVQTEIARTLAAAQRYYQAGSGGEVIEVNLRGGRLTTVEYVIFGDKEGQAHSRAVRYKLSGGVEGLVVTKNPSVPLGSIDDSGLFLPGGRYSLRVECMDGSFVTIEPV